MSKSTRIIIIAIVLIAGIASVILLKKTNSNTSLAASGGCPSINAISNFLPSNIVGASFSIDGSGTTARYLFDSLISRSPANGVPGLIEYCVYPSQPPGNPDSAAALAIGADGSSFKTAFGAIQGFFAFKRNTGNPSNIALDGTTGITMGSAIWNAGAPSKQTILLHINDAQECDALYGGNPGTCFVYPSIQESLLCNGNPACKQVVIEEAVTTDPFTVPAYTLLHAKFTYIVVNQPANNFNMAFNLPLPSTKDVNTGGAKDYFGCEWKPDPNGSPATFGTLTNYQGTGLTMNFSSTKGTCDQSRFTLTAPQQVILTPGQSRTFTVDMITRVNKGGQQEYTSLGNHFLNSGFTVKWIQSDDNLMHSFVTNPINITAVQP